jgi:hypothetical protein
LSKKEKSIMKRIAKTILVLAAAAVLVFGLVACGGGKSEGIVGDWKITEMNAGGIKISNDTYKQMTGSDIGGLTFNEDGTCEISIEGETQTIDYELDGNKVTLSIQGEKVSGTVKGDTIVLEDDASESSITMERE